jgi:hypothetical protein
MGHDCASAADDLPLYWAILRFMAIGICWRGCAASFRVGLFSIRNGVQGKECARVENRK